MRPGARQDSRGARLAAAERMPRIDRAVHHGATALVGLSGVALAVMKYLLPPSEDPFTLVNHPLQPHALDVHVLVSPLFLLAVGMILRHHILARLADPRRRRGRRTGVLAALLLLPMISSGYLLQTVTSEGWRRTLVLVHVGSGLLFLAVYLGHLAAAILALRRRCSGRAAMSTAPSFDTGDLHLRGRQLPDGASSEAAS